MKSQAKQNEWYEQWEMLSDNELFLFKEWIYPNALETTFKNKEVLECGSGGGQHTSFVAPFARHITAVDLNTTELTKRRVKDFDNVSTREDDIATMDLRKQYDVVFSIGVIHHTDDPDKTVENMKKHLRPGGRFIAWVYSREGNFLVENLVEPLRKCFLRKLSRKLLYRLSEFITALLYFPVFSLYLLPLKFLPFFEYFQNFRRLSFKRNTLNVFDKLNAPQVAFIDLERAKSWVPPTEFFDISITPYVGVSWRISATKLPE